MSIISFNWDKHFLYAIIYWLLEICVRLTMYLKWDYFKMSESDVQNEYIYVVLLTIADLLSFFLVLYIKFSFKKEEYKKKKIDKAVELIYETPTDEGNKQKNLIARIIIVCASTYLSRSLYWIAYAITGAKNDQVSHQLQKDVVNVIDIIMRCIFSIFILHIIIHKHRIVSMAGIFLGFLCLFPADLILVYFNDSQKFALSVGYIGILSLRGLSIPFEDTFIKKLFIENYVLPEKFMLFRGIIVGIIIVVLTPILFFSFGLRWSIEFKTSNIISIIIYTLASFVKSYFLLKIIYYFSSHSVSFLVISESVAGSILQIINFVNGKNIKTYEVILFVLEFIGIIIIAFSTLLYDEIIIIRKWGLDVNVRKEIINRGEEDVEKTIELELHRDTTYEEDNNQDVLDVHENDIKENTQANGVDNKVEEDNKFIN